MAKKKADSKVEAVYFDTKMRRVLVNLPSGQTIMVYPGNPERNPITDTEDIARCRAHADLFEVVKVKRPGSQEDRWVRRPAGEVPAQRRGRTITTANFQKDTSPITEKDESDTAPTTTENLLEKLNEEPPIEAEKNTEKAPEETAAPKEDTKKAAPEKTKGGKVKKGEVKSKK